MATRQRLEFFLDIAKAFDTVDHDLLLFKLYSIGFGGNFFGLLKSFFANRFQYVRVNGVLGDRLPIKKAVFQVSQLDPLVSYFYKRFLQFGYKWENY